MYIKIKQVQYTFEMFNSVGGSHMHGVLREPRKNPGQEDEKMHVMKNTAATLWARIFC